MGKYGYSNIDSIPEDLIKVELDVDKQTGKVKGYKKPKIKKCVIEENGIQFEVVSKAQRTLTKLWDDIHSVLLEDDEMVSSMYDPSYLLELCKKNGIYDPDYSDGPKCNQHNPTGNLPVETVLLCGYTCVI